MIMSDDLEAKLLLLSGGPGTGKTTFMLRARKKGFLAIESDDTYVFPGSEEANAVLACAPEAEPAIMKLRRMFRSGDHSWDTKDPILAEQWTEAYNTAAEATLKTARAAAALRRDVVVGIHYPTPEQVEAMKKAGFKWVHLRYAPEVTPEWLADLRHVSLDTAEKWIRWNAPGGFKTAGASLVVAHRPKIKLFNV